MTFHLRPAMRALVVVSVLAPAFVANLHAEVLDVRGSISAEAAEFVDGEPGSTDRAFEALPQTLAEFPLEAIAGLGDFSGEQQSTFGALGVSSLSDPFSTDNRNPAELGLEAEAYSTDAAISYEVSADAVETRTVRFSAEELDTNQPSRTVRGTVFLRGAAIIWSQEQGRDLTGMSVKFDFKIIKDTGTNGGEVLLETGFVATGSNGSQVVIRDAELLSLEVGSPNVLVRLFGEESEDEAAALSSIGRVQLVLLPPQEVSYEYEVVVDEEFDLRAETAVRVTNLPGGTGAGVTVGRPFRSLALAVSPFLNDVTADDIQQVINDVINGAVNGGNGGNGNDNSGNGNSNGNGNDNGGPDDPSNPMPPSVIPFCGLLGGEMLIMPLAMAVIGLGRRQRIAP